MIKKIQNLIPSCPWRTQLHWLPVTCSTNNDAKALAAAGAPHGTVVIAGQQTGGRGRMGRTFLSPAGSGIYMSVILRPQCQAADLLHLTCAVAVAMCNAIEACCGFRPQAKWINDLVWQRKKLGGILTELSIDSTGFVNYAIVGIGINVTAVPDAVANMACCVSEAAGKEILPEELATAMIQALYHMPLQDKAAIMDAYHRDCMTLGKEIVVVRGDEKLYGTATGLTNDGSLLVALTNGEQICVGSGEVSIRGMYGYC